MLSFFYSKLTSKLYLLFVATNVLLSSQGPLHCLSPMGWQKKKKEKPLPFLYHDCPFFSKYVNSVLFYE